MLHTLYHVINMYRVHATINAAAAYLYAGIRFLTYILADRNFTFFACCQVCELAANFVIRWASAHTYEVRTSFEFVRSLKMHGAIYSPRPTGPGLFSRVGPAVVLSYSRQLLRGVSLVAARAFVVLTHLINPAVSRANMDGLRHATALKGVAMYGYLSLLGSAA